MVILKNDSLSNIEVLLSHELDFDDVLFVRKLIFALSDSTIYKQDDDRLTKTHNKKICTQYSMCYLF